MINDRLRNTFGWGFVGAGVLTFIMAGYESIRDSADTQPFRGSNIVDAIRAKFEAMNIPKMYVLPDHLKAETWMKELNIPLVQGEN